MVLVVTGIALTIAVMSFAVCGVILNRLEELDKRITKLEKKYSSFEDDAKKVLREEIFN